MSKEDARVKSQSVLASTFKKRMGQILEQEDTALVRVVRYDGDDEAYIYDDVDIRRKFAENEPGRYVVIRESNMQWLFDTTIDSEGQRDDKKAKAKAFAQAPEQHTHARLLVNMGEAWGSHTAHLQAEIKRLGIENEHLREQRETLWTEIKDAEAETPGAEILEMGKLVLTAWQSKGFKDAAMKFAGRVIETFRDEPEIQKRLAMAMQTELENETAELMLGMKSEG